MTDEVKIRSEGTGDKARTIPCAAGLAPLVVAERSAKSVFRSSALNAATPHSPASQKLKSDGGAGSCTVVLKSRWKLLGANASLEPSANPGASTGAPGAPATGHACPGGGGSGGGGGGGGGVPAPHVVRFGSWRHERGRRVALEVRFYPPTSELVVRSDDGLEVTVLLYGASGKELEPWDLHVGATLRVLGRPLSLHTADPGTTEWIEAEARLLRGHRARLEEALAAFVPIVAERGAQQPAGGPGGGGGGGGSAGAGGRANLRRIRNDLALLAGRLRQHKAHVPLPHNMQQLVGEGPTLWRLDDPESLRQLAEPYIPPPPYHARGGHASLRTAGFCLVGRAQPAARHAGCGVRGDGGSCGTGGGSRKGAAGAGRWGRSADVIDVGMTPSWLGQLSEWKHEQRLLQLSGLTSSAATAALAGLAAVASTPVGGAAAGPAARRVA